MWRFGTKKKEKKKMTKSYLLGFGRSCVYTHNSGVVITATLLWSSAGVGYTKLTVLWFTLPLLRFFLKYRPVNKEQLYAEGQGHLFGDGKSKWMKTPRHRLIHGEGFRFITYESGVHPFFGRCDIPNLCIHVLWAPLPTRYRTMCVSIFFARY